MKELPAGGREAHVSLLQGLLTRLRVLARRRNGDGHTLRETLEELIEEDEGDEGQDRAEFTEQERELLLNALSFGELQVWDVMVPRSDIQAVEATAGLSEVVGTMRTAMHTRLPVYRDNLDDVVGMIHIKDLLPYWGDGAAFQLEPIIREVLFVPPSMRVLDLLLQMRDTGVHMAIVVDEYGGTDGLATIEDLVEEIVGEIQDEHDKIVPPQIVEVGDGVFEADARDRGRGAGRAARRPAAGCGAAGGRRYVGRADLHAARSGAGARRDRAPSGGHRVRGARGGSPPHQTGAHHPTGPAGDRGRGLSLSAATRASAAGRWLSRLRDHPRLAALALGALAALTLPPFHLYPLLLAFAGLLDLLRRAERRSAAFVLGWCFGFAHFLVGLYWIGIAFFTDAERFGAFAAPAVLLLCAYLACYPALAAWLTVLHRWRSPVASALVLALAWTAGEVVRGILFGGFPWNLIGYAFAQSTAISQLAALTGIHGLSLLAVALGALPVVWLEPGNARAGSRSRRAA